jgi:PAS domain S-box-containing protein
MDRKFIRVNRRLCEMLGYPEAELLGLTGRQISHPDDLDVINSQRPALYAGKIDAVRVEKRYLRKDRTPVWVAFSMTVERDAEGRPTHEIAVYNDITAQREAEARVRESEELYRQTFQLAASGIAHVGLDGRFLQANRSLCDILGYTEGELVGRSVKEISHPDDKDLTDRERARVHDGEIDSVRFEKRYIRKNGTPVWVELAVALARDPHGHPQYEIAIFDDITERKRAEAALREAHEELKRSNSELEQFAYVASHDLQEPLRKVASFCQMLELRYGEQLDDRAREYIAFAVDGAKRMQDLINDLLAFSRVGRIGTPHGEVPLRAVLDGVRRDLGAAIEETGARVEVGDLPTVRGDPTLLAVVFRNLIANAIKFRGDEPPRVVVSADRDGDMWDFTVSDNGIGIEPEYAERIFVIFQRLHTRQAYEGTGIGLALCRKIVEHHGGRIWLAAPRNGAGATFRFTLPSQIDEEEETAA